MCIFSLIILSVYLLVIALQLMDVVVLVLLLLIYYHLTSLLSLFFLLAKLLYISKFGSVRPFILRVIFVFAATLKDLIYFIWYLILFSWFFSYWFPEWLCTMLCTKNLYYQLANRGMLSFAFLVVVITVISCL